MKASRVLDSKEKGNKIVHSLSCGHSVTQMLAVWRGFHYPLRHYSIKCPQCVGYRHTK